jgi:hypothetical protein
MKAATPYHWLWGCAEQYPFYGGVLMGYKLLFFVTKDANEHCSQQ